LGLVCWWAFIGLSQLSAQPCTSIDVANPYDGIGPDYLPDALLTDTSCILNVRAAVDAQDWQPLSDKHWKGNYQHCLWYRLCLETEESSVDYLGDLGHHAFSEFYLFAGDSLISMSMAGNELPLAERTVQLHWSKVFRNLVDLPVTAGRRYTAVWRIHNPYGPNIYGKNDIQRLGAIDKETIIAKSEIHRVLTAFFHGCLIILLLYHVLQLFVAPSRLQLWYCALLLSLLAYISYEEFAIHTLFPNARISEYWLIATATISFALFFQFASVLLESLKIRGWFQTPLKLFVYANLVIGLVWALAYGLRTGGVLSTGVVLNRMPDVFRISALLQLLGYMVVLVYAWRKSGGAAFYAFLASNFAMVGCMVIYLGIAFIYPYSDIPFIEAFVVAIKPLLNYLVEVGIAFMCLLLAIAVALLTRERELQKDREFAQELASAKMKAMRAQMNPHFLFNSLNAIKLYVIRSHPRLAADYLTKFSSLIRRVLNQSDDPLASLKEELLTLELYIEMERLRFAKPFEYSIIADEDIDQVDTEIPTSLIQPFVENAIWHGLYHLTDRQGELHVRVRKPDGHGGAVVISICDNGVGREASEAFKNSARHRRRSLGMQITRERLDLIERLYGIPANFQIRDLTDAQGTGRGTEVTLVIGNPEALDVLTPKPKGAPQAV